MITYYSGYVKRYNGAFGAPLHDGSRYTLSIYVNFLIKKPLQPLQNQ